MNKTLWTTTGFILFIVGAVSLVLSMVGLRLTILRPIENLGPGISFVVKIAITLFGIIIIYLSKTTTEEE